jgi:hypothetical protein
MASRVGLGPGDTRDPGRSVARHHLVQSIDIRHVDPCSVLIGSNAVKRAFRLFICMLNFDRPGSPSGWLWDLVSGHWGSIGRFDRPGSPSGWLWDVVSGHRVHRFESKRHNLKLAEVWSGPSGGLTFICMLNFDRPGSPSGWLWDLVSGHWGSIPGPGEELLKGFWTPPNHQKTHIRGCSLAGN